MLIMLDLRVGAVYKMVDKKMTTTKKLAINTKPENKRLSIVALSITSQMRCGR